MFFFASNNLSKIEYLEKSFPWPREDLIGHILSKYYCQKSNKS